MEAGLPFAQLLGYVRGETRRWRDWFALHPAAWEVPVGGRTTTVRALVFHIVAVDMRLAQRLAGETMSSFEELAVADDVALFALAERAYDKLAVFIAGAGPAELGRRHAFTPPGVAPFEASAGKVLAHILTHDIRHWAQIATVVRLHGQASDWHHDLLLSDAVE